MRRSDFGLLLGTQKSYQTSPKPLKHDTIARESDSPYWVGFGSRAGTAKLLASQGATLPLADINVKQLEAAARSIKQMGTKVIFTVVDVTKAADVKYRIQQTVLTLGKLDGTANLAGAVGRPFVLAFQN